jgi:ketosteroid isomerase-like protein
VHEELVREIYARVNADRSDEVRELLQGDAVLELPPGNLDAGVYRGHDAISRAAPRWADSWDDFSMEPEE